MQVMRTAGDSDDDPVRSAYLALGITPARLEILRIVFAEGEVTAPHLVEQLALSRNAVGYHLKVLTDQELLLERKATHPRGYGPLGYWTADKDAVRDIFRILYNHVLDENP